jgi:hypothetical protein
LNGGVFEKYAPSAQLQRFHKLFFFDGRGQNDGPHLAVGGRQFPQHFHSRKPRHSEIQHQNIWFQCARQFGNF